MTQLAFKPPFWMRGPMVQTILAGQKFRRRGPNAMRDAAQDVFLTTADGVRLKGSYSPHPQSKGTVIFIHGWEGSQDSTYVLCCGRYVYEHGYSVFRLNLRDHGDTHSLNEGLFYGALFDEVDDAVRQITQKFGGAKTALIGFSLGGNFALRIARHSKTAPHPGLSHIFAISPVIHPLRAAPKADENPLIRRYFYKKWTTSIRKKIAAFPHLYSDDMLGNEKTMSELTARFVPLHTPFDNVDDFFNAYRIHPSDLIGVKISTDIIMCKHDPVVPPEHLSELSLEHPVKTVMLDYGGHNGFFDSLMGPTWYDRYIIQQLECGA